ncbi:hypothetical protein SISNIDRAFT_482303 [Sistotremastrum niveocremeum HHB9708]|uniref:F-box domain-containing protein n=1 Tax=Sistotremastrum niveocremeum HHB9708 TaxID=1314777 RepID=A0A164YZL9_9AGAM|nr:hypothetical protein SISNIDRAFT_482303 [Sistotremastrum niveocremeum HHB9708]
MSLNSTQSLPMNLPRDICREIAAAVRESDRATFRTKTEAEWILETWTLKSISLTCRMWREEAIPILWSELFLCYDDQTSFNDFDYDVSKTWSTMISKRYTKYLKRLVISFYVWGRDLLIPFGRIVRDVNNILSLSPGFQHLRFRCGAEAKPLISHLTSLKFSSLRALDIEYNVTLETEEASAIGRFFLKHPKLEELRIETDSDFHWDTLRKDNPLPQVEIFDGNLAHLALLGSANHLSTVKSQLSAPSYSEEIDQLAFVSELALLSNPFPNVTVLKLHPWPTVHLDSKTLEALDRSFPALEHIDGLELKQPFVDFMVSEEIDHLPFLPRLRTLSTSESFDWMGVAEAGIQIPSLDELEQAFSALRRIFPVFRTAELKWRASIEDEIEWTTIRVSFEENGEDIVCYKETTYSHCPEHNTVEEYHLTAGKYLPNPPSPVRQIYTVVDAEPVEMNL